jgi:hypothetical protein
MHRKMMERFGSPNQPVSFGSTIPLTIPLPEINQPMSPVPYEHTAPELPDGVSHVADLPGNEEPPRTARDLLGRALAVLTDLVRLLPENERPRLQPLIDRVGQCWNDAEIESTLFDEWKRSAEGEREEVMSEGKKQARVVQRCLERVQQVEIALANAGEEVTTSRNALTAYKATNTLGRWHTRVDVAKREQEIEKLRQRYAEAQKEKQRLIADVNAAHQEFALEKQKLTVLDVRERRLKQQLDGGPAIDPGLGLGPHSAAMPDAVALREGMR